MSEPIHISLRVDRRGRAVALRPNDDATSRWLLAHADELNELLNVDLDAFRLHPLTPMLISGLENRLREELQRRWPDTAFRLRTVNAAE